MPSFLGKDGFRILGSAGQLSGGGKNWFCTHLEWSSLQNERQAVEGASWLVPVSSLTHFRLPTPMGYHLP